MASLFRSLFLMLTFTGYRLVRPIIFRNDPQAAHELVLKLMQRYDNNSLLQNMTKFVNRLAFPYEPVVVGDVCLPYPVILAAGFVKGLGFEDDFAATQAARTENIIPGWRVMPLLVGPVEFGSFTPHPRFGNTGNILWRDVQTQSTQNRIGLRNPGAAAAAVFLGRYKEQLPSVYGINMAPSPGVEDPQMRSEEVLGSIIKFLSLDVIPSWFTLNISCPNTQDDPDNTQTTTLTEHLCGRVTQLLTDYRQQTGNQIPLWVKVSPDLSNDQYRVLVRIFHETGVRAVIATNTLGLPSPEDPGLIAGVGGGTLFPHTLRVTRLLAREVADRGYAVDIIACGGAMNRETYRQLRYAGAKAVQYWSTLVYNGPLAGAYLIR